MIRLLIILIAAGLIALGAAWLANQDGFVTLILAGYEIRMQAAVAILFLLVAVAALFILMRVVVLILGGPASVRAAFAKRRARNAYETVSKGLIAAASGDTAQAEQAARQAGTLLGEEPLALLLRADAARLSGDMPGEEAACRAMLAHKETEYLGLRRLYELAKRRHEMSEAETFAARARALKPAVPLEADPETEPAPQPEASPQAP